MLWILLRSYLDGKVAVEVAQWWPVPLLRVQCFFSFHAPLQPCGLFPCSNVLVFDAIFVVFVDCACGSRLCAARANVEESASNGAKSGKNGGQFYESFWKDQKRTQGAFEGNV